MLQATDKRNREGVALILVVGMLALMMVMGVSFAIFMRTERVAAGNFRNDVQARQLLHVALARAMEDVEFHASLTNAHYPEWAVMTSISSNLYRTHDPSYSGYLPGGVAQLASNFTSGGVLVYPQWMVAFSNSTANQVSHALWSATNHVPWEATDGSEGSPEWVAIGSSTQGWEGRIAYVCINASGLLDINHAGLTTRGAGTNASEIQIDALPDVANASTLVNNRPYDTLQEVNALAAGGLSGPASSFVTYSVNPKSFPSGATEPWVDIGGDVATLQAKHSEIVAAFTSSVQGATAADAEFLYTNLLDYVDADHVPRDLASPCTESVPMINEVQVTNQIRFAADGTYRLRPTVNIEWFYPFVKASDQSFWLTCSVEFSAVAGTPAAFVPDPIDTVVDAVYGASDVEKHKAIQIVGAQKTGGYASLTGQSCRVTASVRMTVRQGSAAGPIVDATPYPTNGTPLVLSSTACNAPFSIILTNVGWVAGAEVIDPRFNWDCRLSPPAVIQWRQNGGALNGSLGSTNLNTINRMGVLATDAHMAMFVSDGRLRSVGEISYLLRGVSLGSGWQWWNTIRLMDQSSAAGAQPRDSVLDYFVVNLTNNARVGVVNPNTRSVPVMTALMMDMPLDDYPGDPSPATTLVDPAATRLAQWWMSSGNVMAGSISNLSQLGQMTNVFADAVFSGKTAFEKEAFFRNLVGLLGTRQNYFVVLLYAQAIKTAPDGQKNVSAECRGVAEIWRDARPNGEGKHPFKVRMLKVLPNP